MKSKLIIPILAILLLGNIFVFPNNIQIDATSENDECDPSYPDTCIPPYPPDLNCGDISDKRFKVLSPYRGFRTLLQR